MAESVPGSIVPAPYGSDRIPRMETVSPSPAPFPAGNALIEEAIRLFHENSSRENLAGVLAAVLLQMRADGNLILPVEHADEEDTSSFLTLFTTDGKEWLPAFTSPAEQKKGDPCLGTARCMRDLLTVCLDTDTAGILLNPWDHPFLLAKNLICMIFQAEEAETEHSCFSSSPA